MVKKDKQKGFSYIELIVVVVLISLVALGFSVIYNKKAKLREDKDVAATAMAAAENALENLSNLSDEELQPGGTFSVVNEKENKIEITGKCNTTNCDWLVIPGDASNSPAKGMLFTKEKPEGKTVLLRRWLIEDVSAELGLKKITVAVLTDYDASQPIRIYSTVRGKPENSQ